MHEHTRWKTDCPSCDRMLLLKLTDGKLRAKAVENRPCSSLEESRLLPGSKIAISNASVRAGVILLDDKNIKVACTPLY